MGQQTKSTTNPHFSNRSIRPREKRGMLLRVLWVSPLETFQSAGQMNCPRGWTNVGHRWFRRRALSSQCPFNKDSAATGAQKTRLSANNQFCAVVYPLSRNLRFAKNSAR